MTTVFVLDDHEVVRQGIMRLIDAEPDMQAVGDAATAAEALARVPRLRPDVAVLDVRLPDGDGVQVCRELRSRDAALRCLMLTSYSDDEALLNAITAGAAGYVLKDIRGGELVAAIRRVAAGEQLIDRAAMKAVLDRIHRAHQEDARLEQLTSQERAVLELIGEGLTNREIADRMFLAEKTVKNYVSNVLTKVGVHGRTQAALFIAEQHRAAPPSGS